MPLDVFGAVPLALLALLDRRQNPRAGFFRPVKVCVDVVDVDEHAVDDVRDLGPALSLLAFLAVMLRPAIVGRRGGEHDHAVAGRISARWCSTTGFERPARSFFNARA